MVVAALASAAGVFYYKNLRGAGPALLPSPQDVANAPGAGEAVSFLKMPAGFTISIFAKNLPDARVMAFDKEGNLWVSEPSQGKISKLVIKDGKLESQKVIFEGLKNPHGLAFDPENLDVLYIAEETKISKVIISASGAGELVKIIDLPKGGNHFTRTLGFGPDGRLYVSIGSTCNVCREEDPRYGSIWSLKKDGSDFKETARGLRNSVFFVWNGKDGKMWATEMGRDLLGDDTPPDEINVIDTASKDILNFGWPICYGKNIHDTEFDKNTYIRNPCMEPFEKPSRIDLQAHSAPLGLAFLPTNSAWPKKYRDNLFVAFHGSWNRTVPTGYKVVHLVLNDFGNLVTREDFITGWLTPEGALGRPVDLKFGPDGALYISDDKAGVIYRAVTVR